MIMNILPLHFILTLVPILLRFWHQQWSLSVSVALRMSVCCRSHCSLCLPWWILRPTALGINR